MAPSSIWVQHRRLAEESFAHSDTMCHVPFLILQPFSRELLVFLASLLQTSLQTVYQARSILITFPDYLMFLGSCQIGLINFQREHQTLGKEPQMNMDMLTHTYTHLDIHAFTHTYMHAHTQYMNSQIHAHIYIHALTYKLTHTHIYPYTCIHTYMHTHAFTHV